jgi:hypothetical protein
MDYAGDGPRVLVRAHGDPPARGVFESVAEQVLKHLRDEAGVGKDRERARDFVDHLDFIF